MSTAGEGLVSNMAFLDNSTTVLVVSVTSLLSHNSGIGRNDASGAWGALVDHTRSGTVVVDNDGSSTGQVGISSHNRKW